MTLEEYVENYKTREDREACLRELSNDDIDRLISQTSSIYHKCFLSNHKKHYLTDVVDYRRIYCLNTDNYIIMEINFEEDTAAHFRITLENWERFIRDVVGVNEGKANNRRIDYFLSHYFLKNDWTDLHYALRKNEIAFDLISE